MPQSEPNSRQSSAARVVLITGAARRVGRAVALHLARAGWDVMITYHQSDDAAQSLQAEIESMGRKAYRVRADLSHPETAAQTIGSAVANWQGRLDALVNNASLYLPGRLADTDAALLRRQMAVNVEAPLLLVRRLTPLLSADRGGEPGEGPLGHVVNMTDLLAERPWPAYMAYCASKAALANLTLSLARELSPKVTVNAVAPGVVDWPPEMDDASKTAYLKNVPLARAGTPQDVADLVEFLLTRAPYITGQIIKLDGGRSIKG